MFKNILVIGGAGYVGCALVPKLLRLGASVTVYDIMLFGSAGLPKPEKHPGKLKIIKGDIRDIPHVSEVVKGHDAVIHLACIANDPSFELNPGLSKSVNYDCFEPFVIAAKKSGVRRFIYASTSSVYGVSDAPEVTEDHPLVPLTDYNKYKGLSEPHLLKHQSEDFTTVIIRPATVCGYSPRTRLDLTVNILTNHAINNKKITVFGGPQKRPNIHVEDISDLYVELLKYPKEQIAGEVFNAGYQNYTVSELANIVKQVVEEEFPELETIPIITTDSNDLRSYHVSSEKIAKKLGWRPSHTIEDAVRDLCRAFKQGNLPESMTNPVYYNVKMSKAMETLTQ
jgi:nucleoside-diphosphate-sugar epimerase